MNSPGNTGGAGGGKGGGGQIGRYISMAFVLPSSVAVGYLMGRWLDKAFGTTYLTLVFLLFGIAGGFLELYRELKKDL